MPLLQHYTIIDINYSRGIWYIISYCHPKMQSISAFIKRQGTSKSSWKEISFAWLHYILIKIILKVVHRWRIYAHSKTDATKHWKIRKTAPSISKLQVCVIKNLIKGYHQVTLMAHTIRKDKLILRNFVKQQPLLRLSTLNCRLEISTEVHLPKINVKINFITSF